MAFTYSKARGLWLPDAQPVRDKATGAMKQDAAAFIRKLYLESGVTLNPQSGLGLLLIAADKNVARKHGELMSDREIFDSLLVVEIERALRVLVGHPHAREYLRKLVSGPLSTFVRGRSEAKDTLWELEVCSKLREGGLPTELAEPDVFWKSGKLKVGVACKKIHSNARLQGSLSKAISQLEKWTDHGFAAINVDEFVSGTLEIKAWEHADAGPQMMLTDFLNRHAHHFHKYLEQKRAPGMIVSCFARVLLRQSNGRPGMFYTSQWKFYSRPDLPIGQKAQAESIINAIRKITN